MNPPNAIFVMVYLLTVAAFLFWFVDFDDHTPTGTT